MKNIIRKKPQSLFKKIFWIISILICVICIILITFLYEGGIISELYQNSQEIFNEKVNNRRNYLQNELTNNSQKLLTTAKKINNFTDSQINSKNLSLKDINNNSTESSDYLYDISSDLINLIRTCKATGVYVVLNQNKLDNLMLKSVSQKKTGLYFRDYDPNSEYTGTNSDLFIERAPSNVINKLGLSTDSTWKPLYELDNASSGYIEYFLQTFQSAETFYSTGMKLEDFMYWSKVYTLKGDDRKAISCSIPLTLENGKVYGVLGIEILVDYFKQLIPHTELFDNERGVYILGLKTTNNNDYENIITNGPIYEKYKQSITKVTKSNSDNNSYVYTDDGENFYSSVQTLNLHNTRTEFGTQKWALIGAINTNSLYAAPNRVTQILYLVIFVTLAVGVIGCFFVSYIISRPIEQLSDDLSSASPNHDIVLKKTGIIEVDKLAEAVETLSHDVMETSKKFVQILKMASVNMSVFEIDYTTKSFFIMDDFFDSFRLFNIKAGSLSIDSFYEKLNSLKEYIIETSVKDGYSAELYKIPINNTDQYVYIKLLFKDDSKKCVGLVEDVTNAIIEKNVLESERDHDLLTGLINRRAFYKCMVDLFTVKKDQLKTAAVIMMDLDGLKKVNDKYGHNCGDEFIFVAANCMSMYSPERSIVSRISGDEFYITMYGYNSKSEIREEISNLKKGLDTAFITLPNGEKLDIHLSGGVAWYPDDSLSYLQLLKYADFAMYKSKQYKKGEISEFNYQLYSQENNLLKSKAEFSALIEHMLVDFHFQPIINAKTGELFAYEALMRGTLDSLKSPDKILKLAKIEGKLNRIEEMTFVKSLEAVERNTHSGAMDNGVKIFINSITSQSLRYDKLDNIQKRFSHYLKNVVFEIIEIDRITDEFIGKRALLRSWGTELALDDFGSGYNNDATLITISPDYVKIDMTLIRNIDSNIDKQKIVENLVSYSKERNIKVIAEGVETWAEAKTAIDLDIDYLQGFYIAKPSIIPPKPSKKLKEDISAYYNKQSANKAKEAEDIILKM